MGHRELINHESIALAPKLYTALKNPLKVNKGHLTRLGSGGEH
jgi:hypothetical protein